MGTNLNMVQNHEEVLVVLEEIARMNRELVDENRTLREDIKRRDTDQKKILADLNEKIQQATTSSNRSCTSRRARAKLSEIKVPAPCRVSVRGCCLNLNARLDFD